MKNILLHLLIPVLLSACALPVFSQEPSDKEQLMTLRNELSAFKKANKEAQEQMKRDIDFLQLGEQDVQRMLIAYDVRIMTNKMLIRGTIDGTIAQLKESQEETFFGYARTRKIVWAALGFGAFVMCGFVVALTLMHLHNKKVFLLHGQTLGEISTSLKSELGELRHNIDVLDERHMQAMMQARISMAAVEAGAKEHKKVMEEKLTSASHSVIEMKDKLEAVKSLAEEALSELEKQARHTDERIAKMDKTIHHIKIIP